MSLMVFISAKTKQRIFKVLDLAKVVHDERAKRIKTSELNKVFISNSERNATTSGIWEGDKNQICHSG
jgi:GTP-binding protein